MLGRDFGNIETLGKDFGSTETLGRDFGTIKYPEKSLFHKLALRPVTQYAAVMQGLHAGTADFAANLQDLVVGLNDLVDAIGLPAQQRPEYWKNVSEYYFKQAEEAETYLQKEGAFAFDKILGNVVGGFVPGILEWSAGVPYAAATGIATEYKKGGGPVRIIKGGAVGGIKRFVLGKLLHYYSGIRSPVVRRGLAGSTFGVDAAIQGSTPEDVLVNTMVGAVLASNNSPEKFRKEIIARTKPLPPEIAEKVWLIDDPAAIIEFAPKPKIKWPTYKPKEKGPKVWIVDEEPNLEITAEPITAYLNRVKLQANTLYDQLLTKAEAGDKATWTQLNNLTQNQNLPTYNELLERVNAGDTKASSAIQDGAFRNPVGPPYLVPEQFLNRLAGFEKAAASKFRMKEPPTESELPIITKKQFVEKFGSEQVKAISWKANVPEGRPGLSLEPVYPESKEPKAILAVVQRNQQGKPIGTLQFWTDVKDPSKIQIMEDAPTQITMWVDPQYRKQGIATKLLEYAEQQGYNISDIPPGRGEPGTLDLTKEGAEFYYSYLQKHKPSMISLMKPVLPLEVIPEPAPEMRQYLFPPPEAKPRGLEPLEIVSKPTKIPWVKGVEKEPSPGEKAAAVVEASDIKITAEEIVGAKEGKIKEFYKWTKRKGYEYYIRHQRARTLLRMLDGKERGPLYNAIMRDYRVGNTNEKISQQAKINNFQNFIRQSGLTPRQWYRNDYTIPDTKLRISPMDKVEYYLASLDPAKTAHLKIGNKVSDSQFNQIMRDITPQEKAMGDFILSGYKNYYNPIAKTYKTLTGKDLPNLPNYSRIFVKGEYIPTEIPIEDLINDITFRRPGLARGYLKARKGGLQPLETDALANYITHMMQAEHYINTAIPAKRAADIINNRKFQKAVNERTHNEGVRYLSEWVEQITSGRTGSPAENARWLSRNINMLRRNQVLSAIGANILVILKTPVSTTTAMFHEPGLTIPILNELMKQAKPGYYESAKKFVFEKSPQTATRTFDRDLYEIARRRAAKNIMRKHSLSKTATYGISEIDMRARVATWRGAYNYALKTMPEAKAIKYADMLVEKTHNAADIMDLPSFFRGGPLEKMLTAFQNEVNQVGLYWEHDIIRARAKGEISTAKAGYRLLGSMLLPSIIMGLITRGRPWKKWTEPIADLASYALAPAFIFGQVASDIIMGYDSQPLNIGFGILQDAVQTFTAKTSEKRVEAGLRAGGKLVGAPVAQPFRTAKGIIALSTEEDAKWRELIWSKSRVREKKEPGAGVPLRRRTTRQTGRETKGR